MKTLSRILWVGVAAVFALSFAIVTGLFNPAEKVNALWLVTAAACFFLLAYRFYGAFLAAKVAVLDERRVTPAVRLNDGMNYHPTNKWVLFGHHFAAIAGAGPLIGPVLAAQFGYLPGFLWILVGAVVAGGVHDFVILFASVRRDGKSMARIVREEVGPVSGGAALFVVLFVMVIAIAGLGLAFINSLARNPWGVFIIGMTIPIALFMGFYMKLQFRASIAGISAVGIVLLVSSVIVGHAVPGSALGRVLDLGPHSLTVLLGVYGFIASALPVWMLLAPRDYLSSFLKIGVIAALAVGVVFLAPDLRMPALTRFVSGGGPIIPGPVFPFLFITIACGAISGGHALFASGTTSKMVDNERYVLPIGYGAMLTEGFVSVMAVIAACVLVPGDYFAINTTLDGARLAALGFTPEHLSELSRMVGVDLAGRPGGAVSLAVGMTQIFAAIPLMKTVMAYWYQFALMFEAFFILTTIDAGTRVCRYIVQELAGHVWKPLGDLRSLAGNVFASLVVVLSWSFFIATGSLSAVWPMFGTANQLLAMLALCLGTTLILKAGKARYAWITLAPMAFMAATTLTASVQLIGKFWDLALAGGKDARLYGVSCALMGILLVLALIIVGDSLVKWRRLLRGREGEAIPVEPLPDEGEEVYPLP
ncbi:MAG: carbon starvation protein A [Acidobacteria bacterium]|nr:carbon starvation protein A [Acidobacteriota bacterium]